MLAVGFSQKTFGKGAVMTNAIKPILDKVIQQYLDEQGGIFCPIATSRADDFLLMLRRAGLTVKALKK